MKKLDSFTIRLYYSECNVTTVTTFNELLLFLDKRATALETTGASNPIKKTYNY